MRTLTAAEIALVRLRTQDTCTPPEVSDDELQILYDDIPNLSCGCTNNIQTLIALTWDVRLAKTTPVFDEDGDGGARNVSQVYNHIKDQRDHWFALCGMDTKPTPVITIGSFDTGLDSDCDGSEYSSRLHWRGYFG